MDAERTGCFIAQLRKEKGWTQAELARQLGVTDKAVSRWETGKGLPDTALLQPLAATLGVSVGELLAGERMDADQRVRRADDQILDALRYSRNMLGRVLDAVLLLLGAACLLSPLFVGGANGAWILGPVLIGIAAVRMVLRKRNARLRHRTFLLLGGAALAGAFVLELLPVGVVMRFAKGPNELFPPQYYSYFSLVPFGYADFTPLITGLLTVAALISAVLALILRSRIGRLRDTAFLCASLALLLSLVPLFLSGWEYMTWASWAVSGLLLLALCLFAFAKEE